MTCRKSDGNVRTIQVFWVCGISIRSMNQLKCKFKRSSGNLNHGEIGARNVNRTSGSVLAIFALGFLVLFLGSPVGYVVFFVVLTRAVGPGLNCVSSLTI